MGFYVRKSVRAGPFRFNLSKSGIGVSAGIPGFRIGTGPRGNYVHAGRHGVYYRASLGSKSPRVTPVPAPALAPDSYAPSPEVVLEDTTGASAAALVPTGPGDLVEQLNAAAARRRIAPWLVLLLVVVLIALPKVGVILLFPGLLGVGWLWLRDRARGRVVAFFDVNDDVAGWFDRVVQAIESLGSARSVWRINAAGQVTTTYQWKVNAGASTILSRTGVAISHSPPKLLATNIAVPTITSGKQALHFLPDRILVREARRYSDLTYGSLKASATLTRFIEDGRVPSDSTQVDTTWRYVNKRGGPDRRFNNNRRLPVMQYGRLDLQSTRGLHWSLDISKADLAAKVASVLSAPPQSLEKINPPRMIVR
jgi:hypothetical protein